MTRGEHLKEPFKTINPASQVPAMQEIDKRTGQVLISLSESHTIMRYLAETRGCPDHWYPKDLRRRAQVESYLDWHHNFLRQGCGVYFFRKVFLPMING